MKDRTFRKGLMGLALVLLAACVVLLGTTLMPSHHAKASTTGPAPSLTVDAAGCKGRATAVRAPRLQHDPLKVLLRGILI